MFILIFFCSTCSFFILDGSETNKTFIVDVDSQRLNTHESDINSEIKFVTIKEQRIIEIFADNRALLQLANIREIICDENAFSLSTRTRLHDIVFTWIYLHGFLKLSLFVGQDKWLWYKWEVLCTVFGLHASIMSVHAIFSCYLSCFWPVIHFLKLAKCLIHDRLDVRACPHHAPFLFTIGNFTKTIIFESIPNQFDLEAIVKFKIQLTVLRLVWPYSHWVYIWPEKHIFLLKLTCNCRNLLRPKLICFINFAHCSLLWGRDFWWFKLFFLWHLILLWFSSLWGSNTHFPSTVCYLMAIWELLLVIQVRSISLRLPIRWF